MAQITLSEYIGFIFAEMTRARDSADRVSKEIALAYAKDPILKEFSVPRFKIPEMDITIPVTVSGAVYSSIYKFSMESEEFIDLIQNKLRKVINSIRGTGIFSAQVKLNLEDIRVFYKLLDAENDIHDIPEDVRQGWAQLFNRNIDELKLRELYNKTNPKDELFQATWKELVDKIQSYFVVSQNKIQNLLVNPETLIVKNNSSDATVFVVKAKVKEEGIFIKTVKDPNTNLEKQVVEFD